MSLLVPAIITLAFVAIWALCEYIGSRL